METKVFLLRYNCYLGMIFRPEISYHINRNVHRLKGGFFNCLVGCEICNMYLTFGMNLRIFLLI